jgi:hypothetical protein
VLTYCLVEGNGYPRYINDGLQRLTATQRFKAHPEAFGLSLEQAKNRLRQQMLTVQHRVYNTHEDALFDFQAINLGTPLTPEELFHGVLSNMSDYEAVWEPFFCGLHAGFDRLRGRVAAEGRIAQGITVHRRKTQSAQKRHHMALLLRLIDRDNFKRPYATKADELPTQDQMSKSLEARLRRQLEAIGHVDAEARRDQLFSHAEDLAAMCEQAMRAAEWPTGRRIPAPMFYGLLEVDVWRRKDAMVSAKQWRDFVQALFTSIATHNFGFRVTDETTGQFYPLTMRLIGQIDHVGKVLGAPLCETPRRRRQNRASVAAGYDVSHVEPFAVTGEGATVLEPGSLNRARGAEPMDANDLDGLR